MRPNASRGAVTTTFSWRSRYRPPGADEFIDVPIRRRTACNHSPSPPPAWWQSPSPSPGGGDDADGSDGFERFEEDGLAVEYPAS
jgi:hypothetical protein